MEKPQLTLEEFQSQFGDISHIGTLKDLLHHGYTFDAAIIEAIDNSVDKGATNIKIIVDKLNKMIYFIDNGIGGNKKDLKRLSSISEISPPSNDRNGLFNKGIKYTFAYLTQLYKNYNDDCCDENNIIEKKFKKTIVAISKSNHIDTLTDRPISHVEIDFLKTFRSGFYQNNPLDASPLTEKIWNTMAFDKSGTGMIIMVPLDDNIFEEAIENIMCETVSNSLILKISNMFEQYFNSEDFSIEIEILNSINMISSGNEINIQIDREESIIIPIIAYNKLHFDKISEADKKNIDWKLYAKKGDLKLFTKWNGTNIEVSDKCTKIEYNQLDFQKMIEGYTEMSTINQKIAFSDKWSQHDDPYLETLLGSSNISSDDRKKLNTITYIRGKKIIDDDEQTPTVDKGDQFRRDTERWTREQRAFNPKECDEYFGVVVKKNGLNKKLINKKILNSFLWVRKTFVTSIIKRRGPEIEKKSKEKNIIRETKKQEQLQKKMKNTKKKTGLIIEESLENDESESELETDTVVNASTVASRYDDESELDLESDTESDNEPDTKSDNSLEASIVNQTASTTNSSSSANIRVNMEEIVIPTQLPQTRQLQPKPKPVAKTQVNVEPIITTIVARSNNNAEYVDKNEFINALDRWYSKPELHSELDKELKLFYRNNNLIDKFMLDIIYPEITLELKINSIKEYLNKSYPIGNEVVKSGIYFIREYRNHIQ